jgi:15-cis-phytoene synthase
VLYAEIGRELERSGLDSVSRRAVVGTRRKLVVLARALTCMGIAAHRTQRSAIDQLGETRFLIDAVAAASDPIRPKAVRPRPVEDRVVWVIELFARLERRDLVQRSGS